MGSSSKEVATSSIQNRFTPLSPFQISPRPRPQLALPASSSTLKAVQDSNTPLHSKMLQETYIPLQSQRPVFTPKSQENYLITHHPLLNPVPLKKTLIKNLFLL